MSTASVPTVSRVSQTPLYDQLRGERINADVPATDTDVPARNAQREALTPSGPRQFPANIPIAETVHGVSSGSEADLGVESKCCGRHRRLDDAPNVSGGAELFRRRGY
jgi:hypothetical protein